jgi:hypothetical protein
LTELPMPYQISPQSQEPGGAGIAANVGAAAIAETPITIARLNAVAKERRLSREGMSSLLSAPTFGS